MSYLKRQNLKLIEWNPWVDSAAVSISAVILLDLAVFVNSIDITTNIVQCCLPMGLNPNSLGTLETPGKMAGYVWHKI